MRALPPHPRSSPLGTFATRARRVHAVVSSGAAMNGYGNAVSGPVTPVDPHVPHGGRVVSQCDSARRRILPTTLERRSVETGRTFRACRTVCAVPPQGAARSEDSRPAALQPHRRRAVARTRPSQSGCLFSWRCKGGQESATRHSGAVGGRGRQTLRLGAVGRHRRRGRQVLDAGPDQDQEPWRRRRVHRRVRRPPRTSRADRRDLTARCLRDPSSANRAQGLLQPTRVTGPY